MSAASRLLGGMEFAGRRMTAEEFFALGETEARLELVDGVVVLSPSPQLKHQLVVCELHYQFETQRRAGLPIVLAPDVDIRFDTGVVYRPDAAVYVASRLDGIPERLTVPPDLVVEVLSPGGKAMDLVTKRAGYERAGVGEYLVVDPRTASVRRWVREGGKFVEAIVEEDTLRCATVAGLVVDLAGVREAARRGV